MSPSIVTALKLSATPRASRRCNTGAAIGASVNTKASMVAMSGAIMPAPLAMPQIVTVASPSFAVAAAPFGKVSVVMMALAAACQPAGPGVGNERVHHAVEGMGVERLADDAGRSQKHFAGLAASRFRRARGGLFRRLPAAAAGERVGVAGIDYEYAGCRPASLSRHQSTGADGHFDRVNRPATAVSLSSSASSTSVRPLIADSRRAGRKAHAGDLRHVRKTSRRERRYRWRYHGCHGGSSIKES